MLFSRLFGLLLGTSSAASTNYSVPAPGMTPLKAPGVLPIWLQQITGMTYWPAERPPYIAMNGIDLSRTPTHIPQRKFGECSSISRSDCSFDCYRCVAMEEIVSCPIMSQTFDDGPSLHTPELLQKLKSRTTFFTQGINVIRHPEIFRQQHAAGHLLATHTWSHAHLPSLTNEEIAAQLQWSIWAMNATAGVVPRYFRPPYGGIDDRVRAISRQFGLIAVFWDRDTFDWRLNDASKTITEVFDDVYAWQSHRTGGLILEHDSTNNTVQAGIDISRILGLQQLTVAECIGGPWYQNQ